MKLKLKMMAVAAAMVATGAAHADFVTPGQGNSTFAVLAWNTVTNSYYIRDLGFFMNSFLPSNGQALTGSGESGSAGDPMLPVFDKTPEAGLDINKSNKAEFGADATWASWFASQSAADVRWVVMGGDSNGTSTGVNTTREVVSLAQGVTFNQPSVGTITNGATAMNGFVFTGSQSTTGTMNGSQSGAANGSFINQTGKTSMLDAVSNLWYFSRNNAGTGSSAIGLQQQFGNSAFFASVSLESDGDFTYSLAAAPVSQVPLPAAAWLMGAGLMAVGGMVRRRKAAAEAQA
jgi:hypothetical protein